MTNAAISRPWKIKPGQIIATKVLIHLVSLSLLAYNYFLALTDRIGGDPVEAILHFTGIGAFNLLLLSLAVSPLAKMLQQGALIRLRRLLGLWAFTYALFHFASFLLFELQLEWQFLLKEIIDRPYITVGFAALIILLALASTSTKGIQKRLGRRWQTLHHWVYIATVLVALHYIWSVKSDIVQPLIYWTMVLGLLFYRRKNLLRFYRRKLPAKVAKGQQS